MFFFRLLSRLPLFILYRLADFLYFLLYYLIGYRRAVVAANIERSFPGASPKQRLLYQKGFYKNLADLIVETIKLHSFTSAELQQRVRYTNPEVVKQLLETSPVIITASHQCNWELLPPAALLNGFPADSVYKQLSSPFFEKLMRSIRSTFGANPIPMHQLLRDMVKRRNEKRLIALVADQVPDIPENAYWTSFLHQDTPFYNGTEKLARSLKLPVVFVEMVRVRRGCYEATFFPLAEPPYETLPFGELLERYRDQLERSINAHPAEWLWSHKRWKHTREKLMGQGRLKRNSEK